MTLRLRDFPQSDPYYRLQRRGRGECRSHADRA